jgi:hypothetical protein
MGVLLLLDFQFVNVNFLFLLQIAQKKTGSGEVEKISPTDFDLRDEIGTKLMASKRLKPIAQ